MKRFTIIAVGLAPARYPKANPSAWLALRMAPLLTLWGTACLGLWLGAGGMSAVNAWAAPALRPVLLQISERVFSRPHDLVLSPDGKFLYVADVGNNVVQVLDPASLKILGKIGGGDLIRPHDVAFDKRGRLLVAPREGDGRVVPASLEGKYDFVPFEESDVSSTDVRGRVSRGESIDGLVPAGVVRLIRERGIYDE